VVYKIGALTTLNGACFNVKVVVSQYRWGFMGYYFNYFKWVCF